MDVPSLLCWAERCCDCGCFCCDGACACDRACDGADACDDAAGLEATLPALDEGGDELPNGARWVDDDDGGALRVSR